MESIVFLATLVTNYQSTLRDITRRAISRLNLRWSLRLLSLCILLVCLFRYRGLGRELYSHLTLWGLLYLWQLIWKSEPGSAVLVKLTNLNIICNNLSWRGKRWRQIQWPLLLNESCTSNTLLTLFGQAERSYAVKCSSLRIKEKTLSSSGSVMGI